MVIGGAHPNELYGYCAADAAWPRLEQHHACDFVWQIAWMGNLLSRAWRCVAAEVVGAIIAGVLAVPLYGGHAMWIDKALPWGEFPSCSA